MGQEDATHLPLVRTGVWQYVVVVHWCFFQWPVKIFREQVGRWLIYNADITLLVIYAFDITHQFHKNKYETAINIYWIEMQTQKKKNENDKCALSPFSWVNALCMQYYCFKWKCHCDCNSTAAFSIHLNKDKFENTCRWRRLGQTAINQLDQSTNRLNWRTAIMQVYCIPCL